LCQQQSTAHFRDRRRDGEIFRAITAERQVQLIGIEIAYGAEPWQQDGLAAATSQEGLVKPATGTPSWQKDRYRGQ